MGIGINNNAKIIEDNAISLTDYGSKTQAQLDTLAATASEGDRAYCSTYETEFIFNGTCWVAPGISLMLQNTSGGTLALGDLVVFDSGTDNACTTTTSANNPNIVGIVIFGGIDDAQVVIARLLVVDVNYTGIVYRGDNLTTSGTAGEAQVDIAAGPGTFARTLEDGVGGVVRAAIWPTEII